MRIGQHEISWLGVAAIIVSIGAFLFMMTGVAWFLLGAGTSILELVREFPRSFQGPRLMPSLLFVLSAAWLVFIAIRMVRTRKTDREPKGYRDNG